MVSKVKILPLALLTVLGLMSLEAVALEEGFFTQESKLASGNWVKIKVADNGVYEISYDELRQMGFENPEKVGIYGRGGEEQPDQFTNDSSEPQYQDDLQPVAVMHKNDKIYFYGQGPVKIRYKYELTNPSTQRFIRQSVNTYSDYGYYFLTEGREDVLAMEDATGTVDPAKSQMTECWDYFYHEKELVNINNSGQAFFGESFAEADNRQLSIPYSIPGAIASTSGSLECRFAANNGSGSVIKYGFESAMYSSTISSCVNNATYMFADPSKKEITLPSAEGNILLDYVPSGQSTMARLDYLILGAKKKIGFFADENQFRAFIPNYTTSSYGYVAIQNASETTMAWDVTSSNEVKNLPIEYVEGTANAMYFTPSKKMGMMMVFDTAKQQKTISGYESVANQNLHGSATPDLLIITVPSLHESAEKLAEIHRQYDGMDVLVVDSDDVINEFSAGTPDAMAYRAMCKMFYDRNPEKIKNLLLFGQYHFDNRQINLNPKRELLISYQTPESRLYDQTFNVGDYYGMMSDYYTLAQSGTSMYNRQIQIGVGHLPCQSPGDADIVINKVAQYIVDDSFAYWLGNLQYVADGGDENEHQGQCDDLVTQIKNLTGGEFISNKVYLNAYKKGEDKYKMLENFNNGMLLSTYFGHGNNVSLSMSQTLWYKKDLSLLENNRLSFMNFAGCSVTGSDNGVRGSTEAMLYADKVGIVGGLMTNRSAYSTQNYHFMYTFNEACLLENPKQSKVEKLATRRTIGEIYAMTKSNLATSMNEYAYQLISDPALYIPLPTTTVQIEKIVAGGTEYTEDFTVTPGMEIEVSGSIVNRDGSAVDDFNGTLVARVCDTPVVLKTMGNYSTAVDVEYDETILSTTDMKVSGGKFSGKIILPQKLTPTADVLASLRFTAYDASKRLSSIGVVGMTVGEFDASKAAADKSAPVISDLYINSSDFKEGDIVGRNFTVYATVSDDLAVKLSTNGAVSDLQIILDNSNVYSNVASYATLSDGGKVMKISFPFDDIEYGYHTITLTAADVMENTVTRSISFRVFEGAIGGELIVENAPAREDVTLKMTLVNTEVEQTGKLYVVDSLGNTVFSDEMSGSEYVWNLKDDSGNRVAEGVYYAHVKLEASALIKGFTSVAKIVVLK